MAEGIESSRIEYSSYSNLPGKMPPVDPQLHTKTTENTTAPPPSKIEQVVTQTISQPETPPPSASNKGNFFSRLIRVLRNPEKQETIDSQKLSDFRAKFEANKNKLGKFSPKNQKLVAKIENKLKSLEISGGRSKDLTTLQEKYDSAYRHLSVGEHSFLTTGKAKRVWSQTNKDSTYVMYTATSSSKISEIKEEVQIAQEININLYKSHIKSALKNAIGFEKFSNQKLEDFANKIVAKLLQNSSDKTIILKNLVFYERNPDKFASDMQIDLKLAKKALSAFGNESFKQKLLASGQNLALNMTEVTGEKRISGEYTVQADKALGDLDDKVALGQLDYQTNLELGAQLFTGLRDLHQAGYVHGDLKLENILVYQNKESAKTPEIKFSDFGKTIPMQPHAESVHTGNLRFASPEGVLSQSSEVYSAAIMFIRILEEELLKAPDHNRNSMVVDVKQEDMKPNVQLNEKRRGIEKHVILNKAFSTHAEASKPIRIQLGGRYILAKIFNRHSKIDTAEQAMSNYVSTLINALIANHPQDTNKLRAIENLLFKMTNKDPKKRLTMDQVVTEYNEILSNHS